MPPQETAWYETARQRAVEKKTHITFPQLKYPSLRDVGIRDPVQWLTGKALDDGAEGLWRVYDKLYDFTSFLSTHPGGEEWLELSKGTDITEAFEAHHINPSVEKLLDKFYIRDAQTPRNSPFTFHEDGLFKTIKRRIYEELKTIPKDVSKPTDRITDGLFATLLITSALSAWLENYKAAMFCFVAASVTLALLTVACHNYIHRKPNWRMYLFNLSMWSYRDFRVSHVLSHHLYPNTLIDLEISGFEPIIFFNPGNQKYPYTSKYGLIIEFLTFPFIFLLTYLKRFLSIFYRPGFFRKHYRWHDLVCLLLPLWIWAVTGVSFAYAVYTWLWIVCTSSAVFFHMATNAAHQHPGLIKDGDEPRTETPDWAVHQLEAVIDRKDVNTNLFTVLTLFGDHALHHLFPTLDHAYLKYLYPTFIELCEKYQAKHRVANTFKTAFGQIKDLRRVHYHTVEEREKECE